MNDDGQVTIDDLVAAVVVAIRNRLLRDPHASLLYTNLIYNDPFVLDFDPPRSMGGQARCRDERAADLLRALRQRLLRSRDGQDAVDGSPPTPFGIPGLFGGPCIAPTGCTAGKVGEPCSGRHPAAAQRILRRRPAATASAMPARCSAASPPRTRCSCCWGHTSSISDSPPTPIGAGRSRDRRRLSSAGARRASALLAAPRSLATARRPPWTSGATSVPPSPGANAPSGAAGAVCALQVWRLRRACTLAEIQAGSCDSTSTEAAVNAARLAAVDAISPFCTDQQVKSLQFLGVYEAQSDAVRFCRELDTAATSAVFNPVPTDPAALDSQQRSCVEAAARATTKLLNVAFRDRQHLLDRIALGRLSPPQKRAMVAQSTQRITRAADALATELQLVCPPEAFRALYGVEVAAFLATIASRGDCLAGATYAQGGLLCPPAACGNGVREPGEDCDDGNQSDGDSCPASCVRS